MSIIIPAFNEEDSIGILIDWIYNSSFAWDFETIVVDDGSTDKTAEIVREKMAKYPRLRFSRLPRNTGKAAAIQRGLKFAIGNIIVFQDADLEYFPKNIPSLVTPIMNREAAVVYGSRFKGYIGSMRPSHRFGNKFLTLATRILFNIRTTDMETGYKAFRRDIIDRIEITANGFLMEPEITVKISFLGYSILEVPIDYHERRKGFKKISWRDGILSFVWLLKFRIFNR
ncbi:MAG: glycosyltransferase family 2 protein [Candidatus Heimdallarchaeota archaeon]